LENIVPRLFTFGCSFTQYWRWPTWADALGQQFDHYENWGLCGGGNSYILWSLIECNQRNKFNDNDQIWIMWTNTSREDRYVGHKWIEGGNVYWTAGSQLPAEYVKNFACERGYLIRDMANIAAAKQLLDHWGCQYQFLSMVPLSETNEAAGLGFNPNDARTSDQDVKSFYSDVLGIIKPSVLQIVFDGEWWTRPGGITLNPTDKQRDFHPTPLEHVEYIDHVVPGLLSTQTRRWMSDWQQKVINTSKNWTQPNRPIRL
jgi:hypothetical protein